MSKFDISEVLRVSVGTPKELETFLFYLAAFALPYDMAGNVYITCGWNDNKEHYNKTPYSSAGIPELQDILKNLIQIYYPLQINKYSIHDIGYRAMYRNPYFESLGLTARERIDMKKWLYNTAKQRNCDISLLDAFFSKIDSIKNKHPF